MGNSLGTAIRLARIVRAAEKWAKARRTGTMLEISETGNELLLRRRGSGGMKLYVTFVNTLPWEELHIIPQRRIVEVEMTPEQVEKLAPMRVGRVCGKDRYEEIETCVLQAVERGVER